MARYTAEGSLRTSLPGRSGQFFGWERPMTLRQAASLSEPVPF
jgi:hypothetical protein